MGVRSEVQSTVYVNCSYMLVRAALGVKGHCAAFFEIP